MLQGFNGEFIELQLGAYLLDLEYRMYTPALMRFQSPDNLSPFRRGGGINCYAYCSNAPVNYTDPTGHALVHLKNGQTLQPYKNHAAPLPHVFKPSRLRRTTSHASALNPNPPKYVPPTEDYYKRIREPDIFESIISNLTFQDAAAFAKTAQSNRSYAVPVIERYMSIISDTDATMEAVRSGVLPGVPRRFGQSLGLELNPYLRDINALSSIHRAALGGIRNVVRLIRFNGEYDAHANRLRRDSLLGE
ncbi:RHS repeat-associated core domain-containing protein [Pseudomonas fulva]|uniref:RHS repeat-associated core domain-containing protein n=1 Tax=Pseudomonas fulva TaxID=47880 RepID=UPI002E23A089